MLIQLAWLFNAARKPVNGPIIPGEIAIPGVIKFGCRYRLCTNPDTVNTRS